jgi:hypothetical protein
VEPLTKGANFRHKFETMNPQNVELQSLYTSLKITNVKVKRKAEEFLRLLDVRAPGGFKHVEFSVFTLFLPTKKQPKMT